MRSEFEYDSAMLEDEANKLLSSTGELEEFPDTLDAPDTKKDTSKKKRKNNAHLLDDADIKQLPSSDILFEYDSLRKFIQKANEVGRVDITELSAQINSIALAPVHVEQIYKTLEILGIEIDYGDILDGADESEPSAEAIREISQEEVNLDESDMDDLPLNDPIRMYLKEIGAFQLLTPEQEIELSMKISEGLAASERLTTAQKDGESLSAEDKKELERLVSRGESAKNSLTEANLRLVASNAKHYLGRGLPFLDLIQEGNMGLMKAAVKYDYKKGYRFSTYATWWIKQAMTRAIADQSRTIRLPVHMADSINKIIRATRQLTQENRREPTLEEISNLTGISIGRIREIRRVAQDTISLETPIGDEDDGLLGDFIPDTEAADPSEYTNIAALQEQMAEVLNRLSDRERKVIRLRFGIEDGRPRTLEEVGREFNVTRERIRQIEVKALRRMRSPNMTRYLRDFVR